MSDNCFFPNNHSSKVRISLTPIKVPVVTVGKRGTACHRASAPGTSSDPNIPTPRASPHVDT